MSPTPPKPGFPLVPSDPPFRDLVEAGSGDALAEVQRELRQSAARRLESLERVYREIVREATEIVAETKSSLLLHEVTAYGRKVRGATYHLYRRPGRSVPVWLSFLEPAEQHQADSAAEHLGSYRLRPDGSWEAICGLTLAELPAVLGGGGEKP